MEADKICVVADVLHADVLHGNGGGGTGEIRVYNGRLLVASHTLPSVATALYFGRYGREESVLITVRGIGEEQQTHHSKGQQESSQGQ